MRELKFRAWEDNKMIYQDSSTIYDLSTFISWRPSDTILMQYTGLWDENGKEIYEGDILADTHGEKWIVKWDAPEFIADSFLSVYTPFYELEHVVKIIGNIYENPELMKGGQNAK